MVEDKLLASIADIKTRLVDLKRDRTKFLKPQNVVSLFAELADLLKGRDVDALLANDPQRKALTDLGLIFSLALLTVGYTRTTVATFAIVLTIRSLLRYLTAESNYTPKEVEVLSARLTDAEQIHDLGQIDPDLPYSEELAAIIGRMIRKCKKLLSQVEVTFDTMPENDRPVFSQVIHLRREILAAILNPQFKPEDLAAMRKTLSRIDVHHSTDQEQHVHEDDGNSECGNPLVHNQIMSCRNFCDWFKDGPIVDKRIHAIFDELVEMNNNFDVFLVTYRWTLRGTDLYSYMHRLVELAQKIADLTGELGYDPELVLHPLPRDVALPYFLVRRCLSQIYKLLDNAEPVSEALSPIYNQLLTMKRCLIEVRDLGGISNLRELYPYQMKLSSLDDLRENGKFVVSGEIPAGQGVLNALLAECYDLVYELKVDLEEREEEGDGKQSDADDDDDAGEAGDGNDEGDGDNADDHDDESLEQIYDDDDEDDDEETSEEIRPTASRGVQY